MMRQFIAFCLLVIPVILFAQGWQQLGDPPFLTDHSYGFGFEGKAYVIQGNSGNPLWEYDPVADTWTRIGDFPGPARAIAVGDDWDGKYYYGFGSGGNAGFYSDLWVFDPVDKSFTELPSCPCVGRSHPALIAHNDKIMMGTGSSFDGNINDWWEYDIITQVWTQKQDIPERRHHPFFFSIDNTVYLGGGHRNSWFQYNLDTEELIPIDNTPQGRVAGTQFSYGGRGYVLAGDDADHVHVPDFETFMVYDPQTEEWDYLPPLPNGSRWAPSSFLIDNMLYYFDGLDEDTQGDRSMWSFNLSELDCLPPTNLNASSTEDGTAELFWDANDKVVADTLKWRKVGETVWNIIPDAKPVVALSDLESCQDYEYQIFSNCDSINISSNVFTFRTRGCGACIDLEYCSPVEFLDFRDLFITGVGVNSFSNTSGDDNGYGNFEIPDPELIPVGGNFNLSVDVNSFVNGSRLRVWIDLDIDGIFQDDELLMDEPFASARMSKNILVPGDALPGLSRMRVSYAHTIAGGVTYDACSTSNDLILGEVEDYCIQLSETTNTDDNFNTQDVVAFPNPFKETVRLNGNLPLDKNYDLKVLNVMGEVISVINDHSLEKEIDLSFIPNGVYFIQIEDEDISYQVRLVKQF